MKQLFFVFLFSLCAAASFGQSAAEEAAIKETIAAESRAFFARNYEQWAAQWAQEENISLLAANGANRLHFVGWADASKGMKDFMAANPTAETPVRETSNFKAQISGDLAWVFFDQKTNDTLGWKQRTLKKVGGTWKLVSMVVVTK